MSAGLALPEGSEKDSVPPLSPSFWQLPEIPGVPWLVNAPLQSLTYMAFSPCGDFVSKSPTSWKDTSHCIRVHPNPVWPHISQLYLQRPYFQIRLHSGVLVDTLKGGGRMATMPVTWEVRGWEDCRFAEAGTGSHGRWRSEGLSSAHRGLGKWVQDRARKSRGIGKQSDSSWLGRGQPAGDEG